jgi:hypothetical protein
LIAVGSDSVRAAGIGGAGKYIKRIFLCTQFPPRREAGDIGIWKGRSPRLHLKLVVANFLIAAESDSVRAARIGGAGKYKKRIFLCARFPPRREAGDIGIWKGRSPRPHLKLVIANFLIAAGSDSVRVARIEGAEKFKKQIFLSARFPPRREASDVGIWGGRSPRPRLKLVVASFFIAAATAYVRLACREPTAKKNMNLFVYTVWTRFLVSIAVWCTNAQLVEVGNGHALVQVVGRSYKSTPHFSKK